MLRRNSQIGIVIFILLFKQQYNHCIKYLFFTAVSQTRHFIYFCPIQQHCWVDYTNNNKEIVTLKEISNI